MSEARACVRTNGVDAKIHLRAQVGRESKGGEEREGGLKINREITYGHKTGAEKSERWRAAFIYYD